MKYGIKVQKTKHPFDVHMHTSNRCFVFCECSRVPCSCHLLQLQVVLTMDTRARGSQERKQVGLSVKDGVKIIELMNKFVIHCNNGMYGISKSTIVSVLKKNK